jgi:hypothetical protein
MSDLSTNTTPANSDVFPITLFVRVLEGSDGTFIVTSKPPKDGDDAPGVAVRPIPLIDEGDDIAERIGAALLREYSELHADASMPTHATLFTLDSDGAPVPIVVSMQDAAQLDNATDDATTEDLGEE